MSVRTLLAFRLRRERAILPVCLGGITALLAVSGTAIAREFGGEEERAALVALAAGNPAFRFLRGLPDGSGVDALVFFQTFAFLAVLVGLMNTFLITRHTRTDEERGREELLLAAPTRRVVPLATASAVAIGADLVLAALIAVAGTASGFDPAGSLLTGLALGCVGVCFAGIATVSAQLMPSPRGANGVAAAAVGIAYLVRGVGDALGTVRDPEHVDPSWVSSLSPIGWAQAVRPFSEPAPLLLLVPLAVAALAFGAAWAIRSRRDLGASVIAERPGPPEWRRAGGWRLAVRNQMGSAVGWMIGTAVLGFLAGILAPAVAEAVGSNDELASLIQRLAPGLAADSADLFAIALLGIAGTLATAAGVQAITRLRLDEAEGRAELILSTPTSSTSWYLRQVGTAIGSSCVAAVAGGVAAGAGFAATGAPVDRIGTSLATILVHLPAGSVFVGLSALAFAVVPRVSIAIGWGTLVIGLVVGQFGELLGLPEAIQDVSPFHHVPAVPLEAIDPAPLVAAGAVAFGLVAFGALLLRRRDIPA